MASALDRKISGAMSKIQGMKLSPEMKNAYQQSQVLAGQGMDAASKQLAIQEGARSTNALIGAAKGKRSLLAMAPGLYSSSNDLALRLAANDAMMRRENQMAGIQTGMQFGQAQNELERYQNEAQYNELSAKKARRAQTLSSIIGAAGAIGGSLLTAGGAAGSLGKLFSKGAKLADTASNVANTVSNVANVASAASNVASAATPFMMPKFNRLKNFSASNMMGGQYSGLASQGLNLLRKSTY